METTIKTAPLRTTNVGLFSGGRDSLTACHYLWKKGELNEVIYCRTGVGLNEEYVKKMCNQFGWKLLILEGKETEFEDFVKQYGFPKPTSHTWIMNRLKTNPIRKWHNQEKYKRTIRLISGIRKKESKRRFRTFRGPTDVFEGMTFFKPILNWSKNDVLEYIKKHHLEISPIYATIGVSGDCFCGAYAKKHWALLLDQHYPELAKKIKDLEKKYDQSWGQYMSLTACQGQKKLEGVICNECLVE